MSFELQSFIIWTLFMIAGGVLSAEIDADKIAKGITIHLWQKYLRGAIFFMICAASVWGWVSIYHVSLVKSVAIAVLELDVWWIVFELVLNIKRDLPWTYISDDGKNHSTSPDDALFHWLGKTAFGELGPEYSGDMKFVFKLLLAVVCISLYMFS